MRLFVDTNVIIDAYSEESRFRKESCLLLALGELGEFDLHSSPSQWTDVFYILTSGGRHSRLDEIKVVLKDVRNKVSISMMGEEEIDRALDSAWSDFEDAVVYQAAVSAKADAIITNNTKDYALSEIPTYTCKEFFEWMERERNIGYAEIAWG